MVTKLPPMVTGRNLWWWRRHTLFWTCGDSHVSSNVPSPLFACLLWWATYRRPAGVSKFFFFTSKTGGPTSKPNWPRDDLGHAANISLAKTDIWFENKCELRVFGHPWPVVLNFQRTSDISYARWQQWLDLAWAAGTNEFWAVTGGSTVGGGGWTSPLGEPTKVFFSSTNKTVNRISVVESVLFHTGTTVNSTLPASCSCFIIISALMPWMSAQTMCCKGFPHLKNLNRPIPGESAALLHAVINLPGGYAPPTIPQQSAEL